MARGRALIYLHIMYGSGVTVLIKAASSYTCVLVRCPLRGKLYRSANGKEEKAPSNNLILAKEGFIVLLTKLYLSQRHPQERSVCRACVLAT